MSKLLTPENILNLLLIFVPIAIVLELMHASPTVDLHHLLPGDHSSGGGDGQSHRAPRGEGRRRHRRPAERDLRQRGRAHHRDRGLAGGALRRRQSLDHRLDHRQHPPRLRAERGARRRQVLDPEVQQDGREHGHDDAHPRRDRARHSGPVPRRGGGQAERRRAGAQPRDRDGPDADLHPEPDLHPQDAQASLRGRARRRCGRRDRNRGLVDRQGDHGAARRDRIRRRDERVPGRRGPGDGQDLGHDRSLRGRDPGGHHRQCGGTLDGDPHGPEEQDGHRRSTSPSARRSRSPSSSRRCWSS